MAVITDAGFDDIREGDHFPEYPIRMDRETYFEYNELVKNINPLHSNEEYAQKLGFRDIVVAGVYTFSFIPRMIEEWLSSPVRFKKIEIRYQSPVYPDAVIVHKARVIKKVERDGQRLIECEVTVEDEDGERLTVAAATLEFI
jgi:acyl dehydratase